MRLAIWIALFVATFLISRGAAAGDIASDLKGFVDSVGGSTAVTDPSVYQSQGRTYFNGGRIYMRTPARTANLLSYAPPGYRAGCNGIDVWGGGFSYINANEMVNQLKAIGSNATSLLYMVGIRAITSTLADTIEQNFSWAKDFQNLDVNTCEMASWAVGSLLSQGELSKEQSICVMHRMETKNESFGEAKAQCLASNPANSKEALTTTKGKEEFGIGNLAWYVMVKHQMFADNPQMRELLMTLTGTIVVKGPDANGAPTQPSTYGSLLITGGTELIDALLHGGLYDRFSCDASLDPDTSEHGCKEIKILTDQQLPQDASVSEQVGVKMTEIYDAIRTRQSVSANTYRFVSSTSLPVGRLIATAAGIGGPAGTNLITTYADTVATDILFTYLIELINSIETHVGDIKNKEAADDFRQQLRTVRAEVVRQRDVQIKKADGVMAMADQIAYHERILLSALPKRVATSINWGKQHR